MFSCGPDLAASRRGTVSARGLPRLLQLPHYLQLRRDRPGSSQRRQRYVRPELHGLGGLTPQPDPCDESLPVHCRDGERASPDGYGKSDADANSNSHSYTSIQSHPHHEPYTHGNVDTLADAGSITEPHAYNVGFLGGKAIGEYRVEPRDLDDANYQPRAGNGVVHAAGEGNLLVRRRDCPMVALLRRNARLRQ